MKDRSGVEFCLIVEGPYLSESEAEHALRDPFIEDWVEQTGRFRIHNLKEMEIAPGVVLGSLGVVMLDEGLFEIASTDPEHPLTERKARAVAEALLRQGMFDEVACELRGLRGDSGDSGDGAEDQEADDAEGAVDAEGQE